MWRSFLVVAALGFALTACGDVSRGSQPRAGDPDHRNVSIADYERGRAAEPGTDWEEGLHEHLDRKSSDDNEYRRAVEN